MKKIIPQKLKRGDKISVIAPSNSFYFVSKESREIAQKRFDDIGVTVKFEDNIEEKDMFSSSSIESRIADLHSAFADNEVKAIFPAYGGFNSNQLLDYIDWNLIRDNPKIFCGFSDITILTNAIYAKTGLVTYHGPGYASFGQKHNFEYTLDYIKKCLFNDEEYNVEKSEKWNDDRWYADQENVELIENEGYWTINQGQAEGQIIGGNSGTFFLLQGTEYMPKFDKDTILFLEDDSEVGESSDVFFDRNLQSIIHQSGFENVRGIVIGRFQKESKMSREKIEYIIKTKRELKDIPIIANVDFGHTTPMTTFPIGGTVRINTEKQEIKILEH